MTSDSQNRMEIYVPEYFHRNSDLEGNPYSHKKSRLPNYK